jgi:hypothetical protein
MRMSRDRRRPTLLRSFTPELRCVVAAAAAFVLATSVAAQQSPASPPGELKSEAACTAWQLATEGVRLADQLNAIANDRLDHAKSVVGECQARQCSRDDLLMAEQEVREAQYAFARATERAAAMKRTREELSVRLQSFSHDGTVADCEKVSQ